ncbi:MAG: lysophospholipid acyltransferase family protein, partial [Christensenellaceae bacterium]
PKIRLMAKKELFKNRFFGAVLRAFGAFPVSRGESDAAAVSNAMKMVADGELVGIFPEGTRIKGDALGKFQPGVAMMAMRSKAAIIPVYIDRKLKLFRRTHVTIGTPIDLSARVDKTSKIHDRIKQGTEILESEMQYLQERTANK